MAAATNGGRPSTSSRTSSRDGLWPGTRTKNSTTAPLVPFRRLGTTSTAPTNCSHSTPQRWAFSTRWSNASLTGSIPDRSGWGPPRFTDDSVQAVVGEEFCDVSSEFAGVLKQKSVRSVRVDFDPRLGNETGQQIGKVRQDHRVPVPRGDEHRMTDRADSLQRCVIRDAPVARRVILCGDESNGIAGHLLDPGGSCSSRGPDTHIVERYDAPPSGQAVDQGRIPILQIAAEVLQQYQRDCAAADFTVGVGDAVVGVNDLIGSCAVADFCCGGHVAVLWKYLVSQDDGLRGPEDTISSERSA